MHLAPGHKCTLDHLRTSFLPLFAALIVPCAALSQPFVDAFDRPNSTNIGNAWVRFIIFPNTGFGDSSSGSSTHGDTALDIFNGELRMGEISGNNTAFHGFCERDAGTQSLIDDGTYQFEVRFGGANAASVSSRPAYYGMAFYKTPFAVDGALVRIHRNGNIEFYDANGGGLGTQIGSGTYPAFNAGTRNVKIEIAGSQTLKVRIWDINDPEPATWDAQTDISAVGKPGTYIALYAHTTGGDNTDIHYFYDNFSGTAIPAPFQEVGAAAGVADTGNGWMISWADYDGDGDPDLHVPNENQADRLLRNDGGIFADVATALGVDDTGQGQGVAWADYDNDGDLDFYLAKGPAANRLFQNQLGQTGTASFVDVAASMLVDDTGASTDAGWADMDLDGDVDLYVSSYLVANRLYRNDGASFVDVAVNPGTGTTGQSNGVSWADYDDDGDPDIYLTQDNNVSNALFRNDGNGNFTPVQSVLGVADASAGRGAPWGDYDSDGDLDLYLAKSTATSGGNALFQNPGDGTAFANAAGSAGVADGSPTFGAEWGDYDNDGDLDLATSNWLAPNRLYQNNGAGIFVDRAAEFGLDDSQPGRGLAWADYDGDGDLDLYIANGSGGTNLLFRNDNVLNNWLQVDLTGTVSNRSGLGARIDARVGLDSQRRDILGSTGQTSHESLTQEFGLGGATTVDELTITWPSGTVQTLTSVAANQILSLTEPIVITIDPGAYIGTYNAASQGFVTGPSAATLTPGTYSFSNGTSSFQFEVDANGGVTSLNADAATGSGNTLSLNNVAFNVDPVNYIGAYDAISGAPFVSGPQSFIAIPTLTGRVFNGNSSFQFAVDGGGNITHSNPDAATVRARPEITITTFPRCLTRE